MSEVEYWDGTGVEIQPLKAEVIRLATESPDERKACLYSTDEGKPECIVGQAVFNITGKVVHNDDWFGQINASEKWATALGADPYADYLGYSQEDYRAFQFVREVQYRQDNGDTWGSALKTAEFNWS